MDSKKAQAQEQLNAKLRELDSKIERPGDGSYGLIGARGDVPLRLPFQPQGQDHIQKMFKGMDLKNC